MHLSRPLAALARGIALVLLVAGSAQAQDEGEGGDEGAADDEAGEGDREACGRAYEEAQESRADAKLQEALEALLICAQTNCPSFVQTDCTQWLTEVKRELPSVVVAAIGKDGEETVDVQVSVDGKVLTSTLDGRAFPINPGVHEFEFRHKDRPPIKRRIVVRQGQQNRAIKISFEVKKSVAPVVDDPQDEGSPWLFQEYRDEIRLGSYIGAGVGAAGIGVGVTFLILGKAEENEFLSECGPVVDGRCTNTEAEDRVVDVRKSVQQKLDIGNISSIAGGAVLALSVTAYLLTEPWADGDSAADEPTEWGDEDAALVRDITIGGAPIPGGGFFTVVGRF